jgi:hypothetical protein
MPPLALTDEQLAAIRRYAEPIHPHDRSAYLQRVAVLLRDRELGDGIVARVAQQAQAEFRRSPPQINGRPHAPGSKWTR